MSLSAEDTTIDPQEIHDILRNDRRRAVIKHLRHSGRVDLRTLSERIAELESGEHPAPRDLRESVYNSLHQTHLPKLDDRDVIDYDSERKTIELLRSARHVDIYMEVVTRYGITWAMFYRTLGVLGLLTIIASGADVPVIRELSPVLLGTIFLLFFGLSTTYQLWSRRMYYLRSLLD